MARAAQRIMSASENRIARHLKHDGVRVGEIIAYRAWRVIRPWWFRNGDDRLHSVLMKDYASGTPTSQPPEMCERMGSIHYEP
jgi:hypothetical protein